MKWPWSKQRKDSPASVQEHAMKHWADVYAELKSALHSRLELIIASGYPGLNDDVAGRIAAVACNMMIADTLDEDANEGASDDECSVAEEVGMSAMERSQEIRQIAVNAAQAVSMHWLMAAVDQETFAVNESMLERAEHYINQAIQWADSKAMFLSTAVQINMSWRRYERALEIATQAVEDEPTNPEAVRMKGMAMYANGDLLGAKALLERARSLWPQLDGVEEPLRRLEIDLRSQS
jgi:tetratricopeptide (TPR) repeat protein